MTITGGTALSSDEIDRMQKDAEKFAEEDHRRREAAEGRNDADNLSYTVDKALSEYGDKIPTGEKDDLVKANGEVKEALKGDDADAIKAAHDRLMEAFQKVGPAMSQAQQAQGQTAGEQAATGTEGPASPTGGDDVVEGEIVDEGDASCCRRPPGTRSGTATAQASASPTAERSTRTCS